jgi:uncharacterized protein YdhG (YjbR/CyaY superfamily)
VSPVEFFIIEQPPEVRPMLKKLRHLILSASPKIEEKLVYNIPFFYGRKRIFYLVMRPKIVGGIAKNIS